MNGIMRSARFATATTVAIMVWMATVVQAAEPAHLVGVKKCRMCHKKASTGNQYKKWLDGPHSKAMETLAGKEAKAVAAKLGIADAQKSGKCLRCHSTAYYFTEKVQNEKIAVAEAVSCESCHGPGKNYKAKSVMENRAKSIAKGMIHPATRNCTKCHNDSAPSWKADRYTTKDGKKTGFDVKQAFEHIKHPNPKSK